MFCATNEPVLVFGFGITHQVHVVTFPVDVFVTVDPVFTATVDPVPDGSFTPPLWVRAPESVTPVQDVFHERESDPEKVVVIPVPTTNPVPVEPVKVTDQVLFILLPVEVCPVDTIPVFIKPEEVFFGKSVILTIPSSCSPFDSGGTISFF
ncbi:hypothetical protein H6769_02825 [Candidatus Peribacteria bacterium]|nr:hypothetical protein [Candidatus Peribacteria bacterium]